MNKLLMTLLFPPLFSFADGHSITNPAETWMCSLKDGKTMDDVRSVSKSVSELSKKNGNQEAQWLFTPFSGDMQDQGRFILMTAWKDFQTMGTSFEKFFGEGEGDDVMAEWSAAATCTSRNFWTVEELYNEIED